MNNYKYNYKSFVLSHNEGHEYKLWQNLEDNYSNLQY